MRDAGIWSQAESHRQWFVIFADAAASHKGGFFKHELVEHWFKVDGVFNRKTLDPESGDDLAILDEPLTELIYLFWKWGLLEYRDAPPRQRGSVSGLRLRPPDEPKFTLTDKGLHLSASDVGSQRRAFWRLLMWMQWGEPTWRRARLVVLAAVPIVLVLRFALHWRWDQTAVATALAVLVGLVGSITPRR